MLAELLRLNVLKNLHAMASHEACVERASREATCSKAVLALHVLLVDVVQCPCIESLHT